LELRIVRLAHDVCYSAARGRRQRTAVARKERNVWNRSNRGELRIKSDLVGSKGTRVAPATVAAGKVRAIARSPATCGNIRAVEIGIGTSARLRENSRARGIVPGGLRDVL